MEATCVSLAKVLKDFEDCTENLELFLQPQPDKAEKFKNITKLLYSNILRKQNNVFQTASVLPKLIIHNFDEEQIWQQLELLNNVAVQFFKSSIAEFQLKVDAKSKEEPARKEKSHMIKNDDIIKDDDIYSFDDDDDDNENCNDSETDLNTQQKVLKKETFSAGNIAQDKSKKGSIVDDKFFKLSRLDEFLKLEDIKEERQAQDAELSDLDDSDEDIDYFANIPSDDIESECEENDMKKEECKNEKTSEFKEKSARNMMYEDFFDPPESGNELSVNDDDNSDASLEEELNDNNLDLNDYNSDEEQEGLEGSKATKKKNLFDSDDKQTTTETSKTPFEKQQEKERKKIKELEESILKPKPWQLTGEVDASKRPENSLIHQPTQFDCNAKQDLVTTDELTEKVESIIKMAISNKAWNDVERKVKPAEDTYTYKKPIVLDQTKSKKSLAEVYEEEYLKLREKDKEGEEDPRHIEIKKLMDKLLPELNALFSHIPKPPVPEIKVVSNLPAITVEEVAPVGISDADLLAPEDVKKKAVGAVKGSTEKTSTDRKRERRKKKLLQKLRQKRQEEKLRKLSEKSPAAAKKYAKTLEMKKLKKNKNTIVIEGNKSEKIKSSKEFFSRFQDSIKNIPKVNKTKVITSNASTANLKL